MKFIKQALVSVILFGFAAATQAGNINFNVLIDTVNGVESVSAGITNDPGATFNIVNNGTGDWTIDLTGSGHRVPGANWANGFRTAAWNDPHNGGFNIMKILDQYTVQVLTQEAVAFGDNIGAYPNGFNNGTSYYAGLDFNGDSIFARIVERAPVATPAPLGIAFLGMGIALLGLRRKTA